MSLELEIVRDVSDRLTRAGIPFMLTGSMALNAYAQPRMTRDVDVVIEVGPNEAERIWAAFHPEYYLDLDAVQEALRGEGLFNAIHQEIIFKVDCIVRKSTPYRRLEFERRRPTEIAGFPTWVVSKEDLILSKLVWGSDSRSEYQGRDIQNLLLTGCDREYVQKWAAELGVMDYLCAIEQ